VGGEHSLQPPVSAERITEESAEFAGGEGIESKAALGKTDEPALD